MEDHYDLTDSVERAAQSAPPQTRSRLTKGDISTLMKAVAGPIHEHVEKMTAPLVRRIAELESRADTAAERGLEYVGTFQRAARYRKGSVCTDGGSAWVALKDIEGERPGTGEGWQLMVKAGRDSRS